MNNNIVAGKYYQIISGRYRGEKYWVEGLWKDVTGGSWMFADGNPACIKYAIRNAEDHLPLDDNVYYGKIGWRGELIHEKEIGDEITREEFLKDES